jgi:enoyl-CoA hydratase
MTEESSGRPAEGDWLGTRFLRFERHGPLAHVIVDRPHARNAMTAQMYFGVRYAIDHVNRDPDLQGLLITGTGDVFIPGGDLGARNEGEWEFPALLSMEATPFEAVRTSPKPVVCAINGICQGGGLMLAMLCDVAVASEQAVFRAPELFRGIADMNYSQILPRQVGPAMAKDLLYTGRKLTAAEAVACGMITRVVPHDELMAAATQVLIECCRTAPNARNLIKSSIDGYYGRYDRMAMEIGLKNSETAEGWESFRDKRAPNWIHPDLRPEGRI